MARDSADWAEPFISSVNSAFPSAEMAVDLRNQPNFSSGHLCLSTILLKYYRGRKGEHLA